MESLEDELLRLGWNSPSWEPWDSLWYRLVQEAQCNIEDELWDELGFHFGGEE